MRITDLREGEYAGRHRISAKLVWEDSELADETVWFETEPRFADVLQRGR